MKQTDPRDALRHVHRALRTAGCRKLATIVGRLLTTLATVDFPWRKSFQVQSLRQVFLFFLDARIPFNAMQCISRGKCPYK